MCCAGPLALHGLPVSRSPVLHARSATGVRRSRICVVIGTAHRIADAETAAPASADHPLDVALVDVSPAIYGLRDL